MRLPRSLLPLLLCGAAAVSCAGEDLAAASLSLDDAGATQDGEQLDPSDSAIASDDMGNGCAEGEAAPGPGQRCDDAGVTAADDVEAPPVDVEPPVEDVSTQADAGGEDDDAVAPPDDAPGPPLCPPGLTGCTGDDRLVCSPGGGTFEQLPCAESAEGPHCWNGACVPCVIDAHCDEGLRCLDNLCVAPALVALGGDLPAGKLGVAYSAQLEASGGVPPYAWKAVDLPSGLTLSDAGVLSGTPSADGEFSFDATVADAAEAFDTATWTLVVTDGSLTIVTGSPLPKGLEGEPYSVTFAADGGAKPYFWGLVQGALPPGLGLSAGGVLSGVPTEGGDFSFTVKALDNAEPTATAQKSFVLPVGLSPLQIIGDQAVDLFVTKIITLPLIVVVGGIPVPYSAKLTAKGGKKPYTWAEDPLTGLAAGLIPKSGIPAGLKLAADGTISGGVSDPSLVTSVTIPFTQITLSGFFFQAKVSDSQNPAETKTALFIIPTVPIGN